MRLLDLFCGAGGAAMGYSRAGFTEIVGIDIKPQPRYPFEFHQGDALEWVACHASAFDAIHASPPCEAWSQLTPRAYRANHDELIAPTRLMLRAALKPWVIENVPSARRELKNSVKLCGTMFALGVRRHRFFETSFGLMAPNCQHHLQPKPVLISGTHRRTYEPRYEYKTQDCRDASGIAWMTRAELDKAIPPAYTAFIGAQLIEAIRNEKMRGR